MTDSTVHTAEFKSRLKTMVTELRQKIEIIDDPQLCALFETTAEVLTGLAKTMDDYEKKEESAWKKAS